MDYMISIQRAMIPARSIGVRQSSGSISAQAGMALAEPMGSNQNMISPQRHLKIATKHLSIAAIFETQHWQTFRKLIFSSNCSSNDTHSAQICIFKPTIMVLSSHLVPELCGKHQESYNQHAAPLAGLLQHHTAIEVKTSIVFDHRCPAREWRRFLHWDVGHIGPGSRGHGRFGQRIGRRDGDDHMQANGTGSDGQHGSSVMR